MRSRRSALLVGLVLALAACTQAAVEPAPTVPPGVFAPTPSIQGDSSPTTNPRPAPTTTADVDRAAIVRVDAYTLDPLPFLLPIPMGDSVWGQPSPNGAYLAATAWDDNSGAGEIHLIDVKGWVEQGSWREVVDSELVVDDTGTIYYVGSGQLRRLGTGMSTSQEVASLPADFYPWVSRLLDGRFLAFGARHDLSLGLEKASIVVAEIDTGTVTVHDLPGMRIGSLEPDGADPWAGYLYAVPGFALDEEERRALVVHADRDLVTEIDLLSGAAVDHEYSSAAGDPAPSDTMTIHRSVALSPDGRRLHVASRRLALEADDDSWAVSTVSLGLVTIDTRTWEVTSRLDEPLAEIHLAPDGERALAWGYSSTEGERSYEMETHGLYVLGGDHMGVLAHHPADQADQWYGPFTFNEAAGVGYVSTWAPGHHVEVLDLGSGQIITSSEGDEYRQMFGPIGVLAIETP